MPIYAYRCSACGHAQDVLQKISAPVLSTCPACGQETYAKQVTAAGFQLKGSGWYVTDFRGGNSGAAAKPAADAGADKASGGTAESAGADKGAKSATTPADSAKASPAADKPAPAAKPAAKSTATKAGD